MKSLFGLHVLISVIFLFNSWDYSIHWPDYEVLRVSLSLFSRVAWVLVTFWAFKSVTFTMFHEFLRAPHGWFGHFLYRGCFFGPILRAPNEWFCHFLYEGCILRLFLRAPNDELCHFLCRGCFLRQFWGLQMRNLATSCLKDAFCACFEGSKWGIWPLPV